MTEWRDSAPCKGQTRVFFDDRLQQQARSICRRCEVQPLCLEEHLSEPHGIFGGLDAVERARLKRRRQRWARETRAALRANGWAIA